MSNKEVWIQIGELLRQHGYHLVQIDEQPSPRGVATMVSRRAPRPAGRPASATASAAKVTKISSGRGRRSGGTTLTPEQVREIRESYQPRTERVTAAALAEKYGVSIPTIRLIISGRDAATHKLSQTDLAEIRESYQPRSKTNSVSELARRFGVTPNTILAVAQGRTHRDVQASVTA